MSETKDEQFIIQAYGNGSAKLIEPKTRMSISDISTSQLIKLLKEHGALIFRNFEIDRYSFSSFIEANTSRRTADPARKAQVKNAQVIMAGRDAMGLHVENGNLPFLPELQFFFCEIAPKERSQTTICDGYDVWNHFSEKTKKAFLDKKIKYQRNIPEKLWTKYLAAELEMDIENVGPEQLDYVNQIVEGQTYILNEDNSVHSTYVVPAVHTTKFARKLAFANSILGPSFNYQKPTITFEDDTEFSDELMKEVNEVTEKHTYEINWEDGDFVVIDNTRYMHGRRKLEDTERKIFGAQGYL